MESQYANTPLNESILNAQDEKLKTAEEVLNELADELSHDSVFESMEKQTLEAAADLVQRKRGVQ